MSIIGDLNVVPFSLTGLQNINATINGYSPVSSVNIVGSQTAYLSSTGTPDSNGNINLDLHIPTGTSSAVGLNYDLTQTNNVFSGTQDFTNTNLKMTLSNADTGYHIGYNPTTRALTYNIDSNSNILDSNNTWNGTNTYQEYTYFNNNIWFPTITNGGTPARGYIASDGSTYYAIYVPKTATSSVYNVIKFQNNGYIEIGDATSPQNVLIRPTTYFNNGLRVYWNASTQMFWIEDATDIYARLGTSSNSGFSVQFDTTNKKLTYTTNLSVAQSLLSQSNTFTNNNAFVGKVSINTTTQKAQLGILAPNGSYTNGEGNTTNAFEFYTGETYNSDMTLYGGCDKTNSLCYLQSVKWGYSTASLALNLRGGNTLVGGNLYIYNGDVNNRLYLNGDGKFGAYMAVSTVMRIGHIIGASPPSTQSFLDFDNVGNSALYGNGFFNINPPTLNIGSTTINISGTSYVAVNQQIKFNNSITNRKLILWDNDPASSTAYFGFGINGSTLRYQSASSGEFHTFYCGTDVGFNIKGSGATTKKMIVSSDMNFSNVGKLSVQVDSQSQTPDVADWNDNFVLFGYSNTGQLGSRSGGLGFCRYSSTDNWLVSLQPSISWNNIHFAQSTFFIHQYGTTSYASHYFYNYEFWCNFSNGATFAWLRPTSYDRFLIHQNTSQTTYFYYNQNNNYGTVSDARTKKDITAIDVSKSKEFITKITPSVYRYINGEDDTKHLGFIAQDVLVCSKTEAQKNIVNHWKEYEEQNGDPYEEYEDQNDKDEDGKPKKKMRKVYLGVSQTSFIPEIIGCIQVMNKENEELKAEVELLKQKNISLEERLAKMEEIISKLNI